MKYLFLLLFPSLVFAGETNDFNLKTVVVIEQVAKDYVSFVLSDVEFKIEKKGFESVKPGDHVLVLVKFETSNEISFTLYSFEFIHVLGKDKRKCFGG